MNDVTRSQESFSKYVRRESALELVNRVYQGLYLYVIAASIVIFGSGILFDAPLLSGSTSILLGLTTLRRQYLVERFAVIYNRIGETAFMHFLIVQCLQALLWGILVSIIIRQYGLLSTQSMVTLGFLAGGTHSLTARRYVQVSYIVCMTMPFMPDLIGSGGINNLYLLAAISSFVYLLVLEGDKSNKVFARQLQNRYQLMRQQHKAQVANEAKDRFLANISHEFRTPMNSVMALTDLLMEDSLTARQRRFTETIQSSAHSLLQLINDILDFAKIEADQLRIESTDFSPWKLFDGITDLVALDVTERGLGYACFVDTAVPKTLRGDPGRLRQVVINLVSNAIKFTDEGEVITRVSIEDVTSQHCRLKVTVSDTGIGIDEDKLENLFSVFDQLDSSLTRRHGGSGLGLSISKRLVEMMDGHIEVSSQYGFGSTFTFTIRLQRSEAETAPEFRSLAAAVETPRVFVAESGHTNMEWLRLVLTDEAVQLILFPIRVLFAPVAVEPESAYRSVLCTEDLNRLL